jgi:DNA-binding response OmpR family regulator
MPDRSGLDVTAHGTREEESIARRCGFDHFVPKPYDPAALLALVVSVNRRDR